MAKRKVKKDEKFLNEEFNFKNAIRVKGPLTKSQMKMAQDLAKKSACRQFAY